MSQNAHHGFGSELLQQTLDQTRFEEVHVIDMDPTDSKDDLSAKLKLADMYKSNGIPFVIKGHTLFFLLAAGWLKGKELDVEAMKLSIGKANISVIDKQYKGEFKGTMTVAEYLDKYWTPRNDALYMHQYQITRETDPGTTSPLPPFRTSQTSSNTQTLSPFTLTHKLSPFTLTHKHTLSPFTHLCEQKSKKHCVANAPLVRCCVWICRSMVIQRMKTYFNICSLVPKVETANLFVLHTCTPRKHTLI